jgi:undecaprenyl-diphosphatase
VIDPHRAFGPVAALDQRVSHATNGVRLGSGFDTAMVRVSRAADHGKVWLLVAGVLAGTGRRGRQAAARGVGSLAVSSLLANVLGKSVFGGSRPGLQTLAFDRHRGAQPRSGSFPSGHAASAAAFAVGAGLESPLAGLVVAPLAGAVAYSRLHTGAHWFSDVVAGAALGAGVAVVGTVTRSGRDDSGPDVPAGPVADVPVLSDGAGLFVVVNPGSGRGSTDDPLEQLRGRLPGARIHELAEGDDLAALYRRAVTDGARALGVCGGDGTVCAAAAAARSADLPLAVFPGGTLNHFAKSAGLGDIVTASTAVRGGTGIWVDVADLTITGGSHADGVGEPIIVLNTFSAGIYADLVHTRERHENRWGKQGAAVFAAIAVLRRARPLRLRVNGRPGAYWMLFAGINRYHPPTLAPVERRRLDDAVLDVRSAPADRRFSRWTTLGRAAVTNTSATLTSRMAPLRTAVSARTDECTELRVALPIPESAGHSRRIAHDGEVLDLPGTGEFTVQLAVKPHALRVYAPVTAASTP